MASKDTLPSNNRETKLNCCHSKRVSEEKMIMHDSRGIERNGGTVKKLDDDELPKMNTGHTVIQHTSS
jgi:hypothetical protein